MHCSVSFFPGKTPRAIIPDKWRETAVRSISDQFWESGRVALLASFVESSDRLYVLPPRSHCRLWDVKMMYHQGRMVALQHWSTVQHSQMMMESVRGAATGRRKLVPEPGQFHLPKLRTCSDIMHCQLKREEEHWLVDGVNKYDTLWRTVLLHYPFHPQRTAADLKEKYAHAKHACSSDRTSSAGAAAADSSGVGGVRMKYDINMLRNNLVKSEVKLKLIHKQDDTKYAPVVRVQCV